MKSFLTGMFTIICAALLVTTPAHAQVTGSVHYVSPAGTAVSPYTSWATAANDIQDAVDVCPAGGSVIVADGVYDSGSRAIPDGVALTRLVVDKAVTVRSQNGPATTIIRGQGPSGESAVRGVYLRNGAQLIGFTVTNGHTRLRASEGSWPHDFNGGGVFIEGECVVSNCVMTGNVSDNEGGGVYGIWGPSLVTHCLIKGNEAETGGGGIRLSDAIGFTFQNCEVVENRANSGGGVHFYHAGIMNNCLIARNVCTRDAGGIYIDWGTYYGTGNTALNNCTIVDNEAPTYGGMNYVINGAELRNCIVYHNTGGNGRSRTFVNTCMTPLPTGTANIADDPQLVDLAGQDYSLGPDSPCIDAGNNAYAPAGTDLAGNARIDNGVVDMGAYEVRGIPEFVQMPFITKIGFSNDAEGDQDVTEYENDETFYVYFYDVDHLVLNPGVSVEVMIIPNGGERRRTSGAVRFALTQQEDGSWRGSQSLAQFAPGTLMVKVMSRDQGSAVAVHRSGYIVINGVADETRALSAPVTRGDNKDQPGSKRSGQVISKLLDR